MADGDIRFEKTIPILRIFDEAKAREFYCDYLGFQAQFEHRFEDDTPLYMEISRSGMTVHLSAHHGDGCPGTVVFLWMTGIEAFHSEISSKGYLSVRPSIEDAFYDARCLSIKDPFGNQLRFNERNSAG